MGDFATATAAPLDGDVATTNDPAPAAEPRTSGRPTLPHDLGLAPGPRNGLPMLDYVDSAAPTHDVRVSDARQTFRVTVGEKKFAAGPVSGRFSGRWDLTLKVGGSAAPRGESVRSQTSVGSAQNILEKNKDGLSARMTTVLARNVTTILDGKLPGDLAGISLTLDTKILEASLGKGGSFKESSFNLNLLTVAAVLEGDFQRWLDDDIRNHVDALKGQFRVEFALGADLVKDLVKFGTAMSNLKHVAHHHERLARLQKQLGPLRARLANGASNALDPEVEMLRRKAKEELRDVEREIKKLQGMRGRIAALKDRARTAAEAAGKALEKRAGGKLVTKVAGKAFAFIFKRFIPVYNILSTAHDVYEAGKLALSIDWPNVFDTIMNGGDGGTAFNPGGDTDVDSEPGAGGEGDGGEEAGTADDLEADLAAREAPSLGALPQQILDAIGKRSGGRALSPDDITALNSVVPTDLTADEVAEIKQRVVGAGSDEQDTVTSVIAAIQHVRPFGEKRAPLQPDPLREPPTAQRREREPERKPPRATKQQMPKQKPEPAAPGATLFDPIPTLKKLTTFVDGKPRLPEDMEIDGLRLHVEETKSSLYPTTGPDYRYVETVLIVTKRSARFPQLTAGQRMSFVYVVLVPDGAP